MKRAKVDRNQAQIVATFRALGFSVRHTHTIGQGFPDIVIGRDGHNWLIEIKDGSKARSSQRLTKQEQVFFDTWQGKAFIVSSIDDVINLSGKLP